MYTTINMNFLKNITISLIVSALSFFAVYGGYTIYAQEPEAYNFESSIPIVSLTKSAYHAEMNDYINGQIDQLNELMEEEGFASDPRFNTPEGVTADNFKELCGLENVSAYCTSMWSMDRYLQYVEKMDQVSSSFSFENDVETTGQALQQLQIKGDSATLEVEEAKSVLRASMAAYNEYLMAYPMHQEYQKIIKNLIKYKLALKDVRSLVRNFPIKFVDASTLYCE